MSLNSLPVIIFEVANVHGGDYSHFKKIIKYYNSINYPNKLKSIKFQVLSANEISTPSTIGIKLIKNFILPQTNGKILLGNQNKN